MLDAYVQADLLEAEPLDLLPRKPMSVQKDKDVDAKKTLPKITVEALKKEPEVVEILDSEDDDDFDDQTIENGVHNDQSMDVNMSRTLELPWFAGCEYQCKVCNLIYFYVEDLRKHIRQNHCSVEQYKESHKIFETKSQYSKCEICDKDVKRSFFSYRRHLKEYHNMSL